MSAGLRSVSPAPRSAVLEVLPGHSHLRKAILFQARIYSTCAIYRGDQCVALAVMRELSCRRVEFGLVIPRSSAAHMRALIKLAQLTLSEIAQDHLVFARVSPANLQGQRMARLTGFVRSRAGPEIWIWRDVDGKFTRRIGSQGGGGGG